ncbi:MAG: hypothetical protein CMI09_09940 [Oceanospirillaceae bacterium]|nr:hypothetical protein [Oceanospirillaceae bacterium]|tara:strand:+ start:46 stop:399 length:354 start_codon:yes stop_codon:yes gene_type:complete
MGLKFEDIKSLEKPYSQSIILYLYWASLAITVVTGVTSMFEEGFTFFAFVRGLFIIGFGGIMCRLMAEAAQVLFRIESHLRTIAENGQSLSSVKKETNSVPAEDKTIEPDSAKAGEV